MPWLTFLAGRAEISTAMMKFAPIFFAALTGTGCGQAAVYIFAVTDNDRLEHVRNRRRSADGLSGIADVNTTGLPLSKSVATAANLMGNCCIGRLPTLWLM